MSSEIDDWANELDKISNKLSDISYDLRDDKYGSNRDGIVKALKKYSSDLIYVIEVLDKNKS